VNESQVNTSGILPSVYIGVSVRFASNQGGNSKSDKHIVVKTSRHKAGTKAVGQGKRERSAQVKTD